MDRRLDDGTAEVTTIVGRRQAKSVERRESALYWAHSPPERERPPVWTRLLPRVLDRCPGDGLIGGSCHEAFTSVEAVGVQGCTTSRNLCWRDRHADSYTVGRFP